MTASNQVAEASGQYLVEAAGQAVPVGYKQTEMGLIPEDWRLTTLENIARIIDPQPDHRTPPESSGGVPYIGISDFNNDKTVNWESSRKIISKAVDKQQLSFQLNSGDIIFGKIGTIGQPKFVPSVSFRYALSANVLLIQPKIVSYFVMGWLQSNICQVAINSELHSTSQAAFGINKMRKVLIPLPPENEQTAIANALSDVDALIRSLEKLIAKKQAIKTATLQQLLTGRIRLPQFALREDGTQKGYKQSELGEIPEDWGICELQNAVDFLDGLRKPVKSGDRAKISGIYPYYGASGIVDYVNDYIFDDDLILLGEDGENILSRNLPLAFRVSGKLWVNNHAHVMKPKSNFDIGYLTDFLESLDYSLLNSGTAQPKLNKQACLKIKVVKPTKDEQTAIATILSDMDTEIQTLHQRLSKTRQIKQGMMQELLTGKTRLLRGA
ncbi:MAG: hypothetical protein RLZ92_752 [Pseudomonadota bacterium]|jgi:type I restriction enzyme S subunit